MKALLAFILIVAFLGGAYYAYIFVVGKSFNKPAEVQTKTTPQWQDQSQKTAELMQRQRDLTRQRQERMRDMQRR